MSTQKQLLAEVEAFLKRTGKSPTVFGIEAMNDSAFVWDLREGKDVRASTIDRVRAYISKYPQRKQKNAA